MTEDKFTRGFLVGFTGDLVKAVLDQFCYYVLHSVNRRYLDFSAFLVFGHLPKGWSEAMFAQAVELIFSGILGVLFVYLLDSIGRRYLYFKSMVFSIGVWFSAYSIPKLLDIPELRHMHDLTAVSHLVTSAAEGAVVAYMLARLDKRKARDRRSRS